MDNTSSAVPLSFLYDERTQLERILTRIPKQGSQATVGGLVSSSPAWLIAFLAHARPQPFLVIVPDQNRLYEVVEDIQFFLREGLGETGIKVLPFPHVETLPYETKPPEMSIEVERAEVFKQLLAPSGQSSELKATGKTGSQDVLDERFIVVAPIRALQRRLPPAWLVRDILWVLEVGSQVDRNRLIQWAEQEGYERRDLVAIPGQYSIRGGIMDLFAFTHEVPIRIEFFGDEIDSIRLFDPMTQRSVKQVKSVHLVPLGRENLIVQSWRSGQPLDSLFAYVPKQTFVALCEEGEIEREAERVMELVLKMYHQTELPDEQSQDERVPPDILYSDYPSICCELQQFPLLQMASFRSLADELEGVHEHDVDFRFRTLEFQQGDHKARLAELSNRLNQGLQAALCCDNEGQKERLEELLRDQGILEPDAWQRLRVLVGELHHGFSSPDTGWAILTDREVFRRYKRIRAPRHAGLGIPVRDVLDLRPDDYVVHEEHGIAQFARLARLKVEGKEEEFIELRFADQGKLFVPVDNVHLIGRYVAGSEQAPKLSKLGSKAWENTKRRAQEAIEEMSGELLELYARRSVAQGMAFSQDSPWQREFEASFVYNETPDQLRSIEEVKKDMESPKPMDRLLCGDVGFGKTEVALRAAFKSVMEGKQVAILVPTTILAQQHYRTFTERMADYPIQVRDLSRFRSAAEQKETIRELAQAKVDVVIGTHRLLSADVKFRDLGLLIVDEEQRFGVKHKERLKQMKTSVDVLTLTATPIPRTLYLSLSGLRDMSQLSVAPEDRLPVLTYVVDFKAPIIESAILREMARGGQIYFLHNRVQTIGSMANYIRKLVPDARVAVAHGQMPEKQLERLMLEFVEYQYDVLVCTTIIESGLDIPNVNTILINRADMFGLADLYQLRGRVGRERHQAYCYLLVPGSKAITPQARERLLALQEFWKLGEGLNIALRDMEIRGTGNLLGRQQHGHIAAIGFDLYHKMLRETVTQMKGTESHDNYPETVLESSDRGEIPPTFVESARQRLALYKKLAVLRTADGLDEFREEMRDLYGPLPPETERLFTLRRLRAQARQAGVEYLNVGKNRVRLRFCSEALKDFDARVILDLANLNRFRIQMNTRDGLSLVVVWNDPTEEELLRDLGEIIQALEKGKKSRT